MGRSKQSKKKNLVEKKNVVSHARVYKWGEIFFVVVVAVLFGMWCFIQPRCFCFANLAPPPTSRVFFHIGVFSCSNVHSRPFVANSVFVIITAHVKDYDTPGSPSITIDTRVWNWMPPSLCYGSLAHTFPLFYFPPAFLYTSYTPLFMFHFFVFIFPF